LFLADLKVVGDDGLHKKTQAGQQTSRQYKELIALNAILIPLVMVPGYNDGKNNIKRQRILEVCQSRLHRTAGIPQHV